MNLSIILILLILNKNEVNCILEKLYQRFISLSSIDI